MMKTIYIYQNLLLLKTQHIIPSGGCYDFSILGKLKKQNRQHCCIQSQFKLKLANLADKMSLLTFPIHLHVHNRIARRYHLQRCVCIAYVENRCTLWRRGSVHELVPLLFHFHTAASTCEVFYNNLFHVSKRDPLCSMCDCVQSKAVMNFVPEIG